MSRQQRRLNARKAEKLARMIPFDANGQPICLSLADLKLSLQCNTMQDALLRALQEKLNHQENISETLAMLQKDAETLRTTIANVEQAGVTDGLILPAEVLRSMVTPLAALRSSIHNIKATLLPEYAVPLTFEEIVWALCEHEVPDEAARHDLETRLNAIDDALRGTPGAQA